MRRTRRSLAPVLLSILAGATALVRPAAARQPAASEATQRDVAAPIKDVTIYRGRAAVTRSVELTLAPARYALRFTGLPEAIRPDTIQARVRGGGRILGVDYEARPTAEAASERVAELDRRLEAVRRDLAAVAGERTLIADQAQFIDQVSVRAAGSAGEKGGTPALDLDVVRRQFEFVTEERARLLEARTALDERERALQEQLARLEAERRAVAGGGGLERTAIVSAVFTTETPVVVDLSYLVGSATWEPRYNVRAAADGSAVDLEYEAVITQRTGEDWTDVAVTLSTAQPTLAADPPELRPWYVDVVDPAAPARGVAAPMEKQADPPPPAAAEGMEPLSSLAADAAVGGRGPSVTYSLPRLITVASDARKQQRTRVTSIRATAEFVHEAVPLLTEAVYVRGRLTNASAYQLLAGPAAIFIGQDYVGPTRLEDVAASGAFDVYFGIDRSVTARRTIVSKDTARTGLLGGGRKTSYDYRIAVDNGTGKTIDLELWDRMPVSRSGDVEISLVDLSASLDEDPAYLEEDRPRGLLRRRLAVPPDPTGASPHVLTWGVRIVRAKDVELSGLPE